MLSGARVLAEPEPARSRSIPRMFVLRMLRQGVLFKNACATIFAHARRFSLRILGLHPHQPGRHVLPGERSTHVFRALGRRELPKSAWRRRDSRDASTSPHSLHSFVVAQHDKLEKVWSN